MTVAEIVILIIGAILFTISFFIPDRDSEGNMDGQVSKEMAKKAVKDAVSEEMKQVKVSIEEAYEDSITDNKDKMERFMDRLTNEKMMAVSEYSDTVLEQIHKDHEEAVFLYDMIDSKYTQVKSTAAEINQLEKDVRKLSENIKVGEVDSGAVKRERVVTPVVEAEPVKAPVKTTVKEETVSAASFEPITAPKIDEILASQETKAEKAPKKSAKKETKKAEPKAEEAANVEPIANSAVELMFDSDSNSMNNNDRILALHKEGKSNMAIAKELGLGVGEVKLVIDLFKS